MDYGFLSIVPPILAIILAFITRDVYLSLFISVFFGATIIAGNPIMGFLDMFTNHIFKNLVDPENMEIVVLMIIIGGFVKLVDDSKAANAFAKSIIKFVNTKVKAQIVLFFSGIAIFFSDSGNSLILGPIFRPIADRLKISREKIAFIVDCTSTLDTVLIPIGSWGVFIMGLIKTQYDLLGIAETEVTAFIKTIPFQFYPIAMLLMIPLIALSKRDFGLMAKAELAAKAAKTDSKKNEVETTATAYTIILPMITLLLSMAGILIYYVSLNAPGVPLSGSQVRTSLCVGFLLAAFVIAFLIIKQKIMNFNEVFNTWLDGAGDMVSITIMLTLAWCIGSISAEMNTAEFIVKITHNFLFPSMIPLLIFIIGAFMSFANGTSWGTFAILMPITIPLAYSFNIDMHLAIGAVLSGGLIGDHISPISDTAMLSSMSTGCNHMSHIRTQMQYALIPGISTAIGYFVAVFLPGYTSLIFTIALMVTITLLILKFKGTYTG